MTTDRVIHSDLAIPPGDYLVEVLEFKGISQAELGRRMARPAQMINEIVKGEKAITPETALQLERSLDVPAHIWTGLEAQYQLVLARRKEVEQLERDIPLLEYIPYSDLAKLSFVKKVQEKLEKVRELQRFFGVSALGNIPQVKAYSPAFRCAEKRKASPYALAAWLKCGEVRANAMNTKPFSRERLEANIGVIRGLSRKSPEEFLPELEKILAECGVALVMMPHLPKTYAHGATFWTASDKAVLMMSLRGSWADIFWFSLLHELAHILKHDKRLTFIDDGCENPDVKQQEVEANVFAAEQLIPSGKYQGFIKGARCGVGEIREFAEELGVAPGIVVGRLQHDGVVRIDTMLNSLRVRFKWA